MVDENPVAGASGAAHGDASRPWERLSSGFEKARAREESLDRLVEWPAQRALLGDVTDLAILDAGCGNGARIAQLAIEGAAVSVGVDISGDFIAPRGQSEGVPEPWIEAVRRPSRACGGT